MSPQEPPPLSSPVSNNQSQANWERAAELEVYLGAALGECVCVTCSICMCGDHISGCMRVRESMCTRILLCPRGPLRCPDWAYARQGRN